MSEIVVVDYGSGNIRSVVRALECSGARAVVTGDSAVVRAASKVVLPGVGAFSPAMKALNSRGLDVALKEFVSKGGLLLGICLGMQLLFDESEEFGRSKGLGLIAGTVKRIPLDDGPLGLRKVPHIGWSELYPSHGRKSWQGRLLTRIPVGAAAYFVHSYMAYPRESTTLVGSGVVNGFAIAAAVECENVFGCQFHPEKSGEVGLRVLEKFLSL